MEPDAVEIRVLGCLIEKQRTTPDVYPLTLNALRLACNQSTNRDPVVDYDENTIRTGIDRLVQRKWATLASWANRRSMKYRHTLDGALGLGGRGLVRRIERRPGQREERYVQLLGEGVEETPVAAAPASAAPAPPSVGGTEQRLERVERQIGELRDQIKALREELGA